MGVRVENIDWKFLLFEFDGRINRGKFWAGFAATWVIGIVGGILFGIAAAVDSGAVWVIIGFLLIMIYVALIWMGLAISIKRWHDRGKSGWWILIGIVPIIGGIWALVETGFLEGDSGDNQYGANPLLV
jgi:uncharacterized membrane protein YhaH (DUF805 family)